MFARDLIRTYLSADGSGGGASGGGTGDGSGSGGGQGGNGGNNSSDLAAIQAEIAALKAERDDLKTRWDAAENEKLSEVERLKKERDTLAAERESALQTARQTRAEAAIANAANKAGIDPTIAARLVTPQFDKDGNPTGIDAAITQLVKDHPYLVADTAVHAGRKMNAPSQRQQDGTATFTREQIGNMSASEYAKNRTAILAAAKKRQITE